MNFADRLLLCLKQRRLPGRISRWLWPLEKRLHQIRREYLYKKALGTRVFRCDPKAPVEIHTLLCHRHVPAYLAAIKSLLRFHDRVSIVVHDDGSLDENDQRTLSDHVQGIRILTRKSADQRMEALLKDHPHCLSFRRNCLIALQLFDYALLADTPRIVSFDSDLLVVRRPDRFIEWLEDPDGREVIHIKEKEPCRQKAFLDSLGCDYPPHFCAGFFCAPKDVVDLALVEDLLAKGVKQDWWLSQNLYPLLLKACMDRYRISMFDERHYQDSNNFGEGAVLRHYWSSIGKSDTLSQDLHCLFKELDPARI